MYRHHGAGAIWISGCHIYVSKPNGTQTAVVTNLQCHGEKKRKGAVGFWRAPKIVDQIKNTGTLRRVPFVRAHKKKKGKKEKTEPPSNPGQPPPGNQPMSNAAARLGLDSTMSAFRLSSLLKRLNRSSKRREISCPASSKRLFP